MALLTTTTMLSLLPSSMLSLSLTPQLPSRMAALQPASVGYMRSCPVSMPSRTTRSSLFNVHMQEPAVETDFFDEFQRSDPLTGEQQPISFAEKEKLYLECLDAFYNEGGKQLLPDDEYETLKTDLNFEGRRATTATTASQQTTLSAHPPLAVCALSRVPYHVSMCAAARLPRSARTRSDSSWQTSATGWVSPS